jgi:predicted nucleic acid-binding protein
MAVYCIDTSALIEAWQVDYPIENFPGFWNRMEELIETGRLVAPDEVLREMTKRSDELHAWLEARKQMFRELIEPVQIEAAAVLAKYPRLVGERKFRTSADPFVIALARVEGLRIITDEKPTGSLQRPNIPDVCTDLGMPPCWPIIGLIRAEKWVLG